MPTGGSNTAIGADALRSNYIGTDNVALGDSAGYLSVGSGNIFLGKNAGATETGNNKFYLGNNKTSTLLYGDIGTGQLLIGNANPAGYAFKGNRKLNVLGGMLIDSIRMAPSANWADYVFADEYQLMPLNELGNFITTNKHLPNIPTAAAVAVNGIELGEINAKLLEKVEELTLYILHQQKNIEHQQEELEMLKSRLDKMDRR